MSASSANSSRIWRRGKDYEHTHGLAIPTTLKDACDPQRTALLVYDMQVGICSQVKTAGQIVTRISGMLAVARSRGMRVAFTRHLSLPKTWMGAMQYRTAMTWQGKDEPDSVAPWFLARRVRLSNRPRTHSDLTGASGLVVIK